MRTMVVVALAFVWGLVGRGAEPVIHPRPRTEGGDPGGAREA